MFNIIPNKENVNIKPVVMACDSVKDMEHTPPNPLPIKNFFMYLCGGVGSGKSTLFYNLTHSKHEKVKKKDLTKNYKYKKPQFYYDVFDKVYLFSCSLATMDMKKIKIPEEQIYGDYEGELLQSIIEYEKESGENPNTLFIFDDCIKSIARKNSTNQDILHKLILNRRHCTTDNENPKSAGNSIMILSQKYNLLPLTLRNAISDLIIFKTNNNKEIFNIWEEFCQDLTFENFKKLLKYVFDKPHNFLYLKVNNPTETKFYKNFDLITFPANYFD
jgi:GTPase SAR1 family protein